MPRRSLVCLLLYTLLPGGAAYAENQPAWPRFDTEHLQQGRSLWLENCLGCHGDGTADAPIPSDGAAWLPRLEQEQAVLYEHALNGFFGPDDSHMPARGGNPNLSDEDVKAAVDYMVAVVKHFLKEERNDPSARAID